jgi:hypothetical protein
MNTVLEKIINWSEVWALLRPLAVILFTRPAKSMQPLMIYVVAALVLNLTANVIVEMYYSLPAGLRNNNILYNLHSISRVLLFGWFIMSIREYHFPQVFRSVLAGYIVLVIINFIFSENILFLSSRLFTAEAIVLITLTLSFFFRSMLDDSKTNWLRHPAFLVCSGILMYEAVSFFIFLFFYPLAEKNPEFGNITMTVHNIIYLIFCVTLALGFYRARTRVNSPGIPVELNRSST